MSATFFLDVTTALQNAAADVIGDAIPIVRDNASGSPAKRWARVTVRFADDHQQVTFGTGTSARHRGSGVLWVQFFDTLQNQDAGKWVLQQCDQVATALRSLTLPDVGTVLLTPTVVPSSQDGGFYGAGIRVRFTCEDVFTTSN